VRLRRLKDEMGDDLMIEWRAFPLRPEPDPDARFKGTRREEGWRRCHAMSEGDGIRFTPWPRAEFPAWSMPALEAAKCAARQGPELFERLHLKLYEVFFTESVNIADPAELYPVIEASGADMGRFVADFEAGAGRAPVAEDYRQAIQRHQVRAIPTVIVDGGPRLTGLAELAAYRKAIEAGRSAPP
jgi:predicted DsbA family dithiol-disulfide isomerase